MRVTKKIFTWVPAKTIPNNTTSPVPPVRPNLVQKFKISSISMNKKDN